MTHFTEAGIMPLSYWRMSLVVPRDISTNHHVWSKPGPKINDKHDKDKLEYAEVSMCEARQISSSQINRHAFWSVPRCPIVKKKYCQAFLWTTRVYVSIWTWLQLSCNNIADMEWFTHSVVSTTKSNQQQWWKKYSDSVR